MNIKRIFKRFNPSKIASLAHGKLFFSQCGEDVILEALLDPNDCRTYVDVGAFHPYKFSNTCRLYNAGWSGINIEPQPNQYLLFKKHRKRDINLNLAIGLEPGKANLYIDDACTSLKEQDVQGRDLKGVRKSLLVNVDSLANVLSQHLKKPEEFAFLSVDCEGFDLDVLKSNDWDRFRPEVIAVEDHESSGQSAIRSFLESLNYTFVFQTGPTSFYRSTLA